MTVLVTGGAGYIGSHMVLDLLDAGEDILVLDNLSTGFAWALPAGTRLIRGDFGDAALLEEIFSTHPIEAVLHFAARSIVPESVAQPLDYYDTNVAGGRVLLAQMLKAGVKTLIFSSTATVYGDAATSPLHEGLPPCPLNPYGRSKLMVEWMIEDAARAHGLRCVVLRYFNVAGADPRGRTGQSSRIATHLIKIAVQAALGLREGLEIFGDDYQTPDGTCLRDYIAVSDLVRAHSDALSYLRAGGANLTCNVGYGRGYSVRDVIASVQRVSGRDLSVRMTGRRAGDPASLIASNERICTALGWRPQFDDLDLITQQALSWERQLQQRLQPA